MEQQFKRVYHDGICFSFLFFLVIFFCSSCLPIQGLGSFWNRRLSFSLSTVVFTKHQRHGATHLKIPHGWALGGFGFFSLTGFGFCFLSLFCLLLFLFLCSNYCFLVSNITELSLS
ncbi:hypothetical protein B0T20DRAFT_270021 [Sordaria brevicollis]|uniref:Transmembrane protein n=1 Tax=Sordaria brevicollis TaxID=83679 RepID=A0AAE0UAB3_SORBR|nr:hypothetical protein B0T20DRAFT_270021 [Sordaria brevicollis]